MTTPMSMPIYLAAVSQTPEAIESPGIVELMTSADAVVQLVLLVLIGMSIACWVIIFNKYSMLRKAAVATESFLDVFWKSQRLDQVYDRANTMEHSPVAAVFKAGYVELSKLTKAKQGDQNASLMDGEENLSRALRKAARMERTNLENMTTFLATTGSTAPFIGLFGTVWGILLAFQKIGATGQASLAVVGPDIAHALIATAIGLAAAIPAVMAYNYFNSRIRVLEDEMGNFSSDFLNIVKRHFRSA
ncbi:MAG: protein TolQ [Myxococcota bacterium]|mgnify:FL=1|nr:protein TolQ [Myxococcota bacterium]MEC9390187.1 protein TolQ [Myxococcota bacterium]